jgi:hypothetical protein
MQKVVCIASDDVNLAKTRLNLCTCKLVVPRLTNHAANATHILDVTR